MKRFTAILALTLATSTTYAGSNLSEEETCSRLRDRAYESCAEIICEDAIAQDGECVRDGDFHVMANECASEEVMTLIEQYNHTSEEQINCDDY